MKQTAPLSVRIKEYLRTLAPHVRQRDSAVLLAEAASELPGRWIPVTERLPGFGQFVIVAYTEALGDERAVGAETHYNDGVWTNADRMKSGQPTHWMPLPESPISVCEQHQE